MILPIYLYGQSVLRKVTEDITPDYPELKKLIQDMFETVEQAEGIGLAAPQIGLPIRLVIIDLTPLADESPEYADFKKVYINAHIIETSEETDSMDEGCLSLPGIHEKVTRPSRIHVQYMDENFVEHDEWVDGFLARVMQHEFDHLEGKVFVDRISPLRRQMNKNRLSNLLNGKAHCTYKTKRVIR
ncbi:MAG: peptide deformylase [Bacteroidaceae bacterium]|jgi:peptide deformylase|nr:peptide deformylase [Bacteroidaceae bacterium]